MLFLLIRLIYLISWNVTKCYYFSYPDSAASRLSGYLGVLWWGMDLPESWGGWLSWGGGMKNSWWIIPLRKLWTLTHTHTLTHKRMYLLIKCIYFYTLNVSWAWDLEYTPPHNSYTYSYTQLHIQPYTFTHTPTHPHTQIHTDTHTHTHTHIDLENHNGPYTQKHTHTDPHTPTQTHTPT